MRLKSAKLTDLSGDEEMASSISIICYSKEVVSCVVETRQERH